MNIPQTGNITVLFIIVLGIACFTIAGAASAQDFKTLTTQDVIRLLDNGRSSDAFNLIKESRAEKPSAAKNKNTGEDADRQSVIEKSFSDRTETVLTQFGYDIFTGNRQTANNENISINGSVQDNYIIGSGDTLTVTLRGTKDETEDYTVTPEGTLLIEGLEPISVAGVTIGDLRKKLEHLTQERLMNTGIFVSLKNARQIGVMVLGEVDKPSLYQMSPFQSVPDAIYRAGGIKKTGSLRSVKLIRGKDQIIFDLYALILEGEMPDDIQLRDGDRLVVPMIGSSVAVAGDVKRSGIFETPRGREKYTMADLTAISGGVLKSGANRFIKLSLDERGNETVSSIDPEKEYQFKDGDILLVQAAAEKRAGSVKIIGPTRKIGTHTLYKTPTLASLLPNSDSITADAYPLIGFIKRFNSESMSEEWLDFSPKNIVTGREDRPLKNDDVVILFKADDILTIDKKVPAPDKNGGEKDAAAALNAIEPSSGNIKAEPDEMNDDGIPLIPPPSAIDLENTLYSAKSNPIIRKMLVERSVRIRGGIRNEGLYPVSGKAPLRDIIAAAGGVTPEADTGAIEVTMAPITDKYKASVPPPANKERTILNLSGGIGADFVVRPHDTVRINKKFNPIEEAGVKILGEVKSPGVYDLKKGDTLLDLIGRAGGLTEYAYANGAVFTRVSAKKMEQKQFTDTADELERRISLLITETGSEKEQAETRERIKIMQDTIDKMRRVKAVGRITVEADPVKLKDAPDNNLLLEEGDMLYFPKIPSSVAVRGEVQSPALLAYGRDKSAYDYVREAGGLTRGADDDKAFVLFPDGSSRPVTIGSWTGQGFDIPPGSTVIVPRDPKPFDGLAFTGNLIGILSNLAITTMAIENITEYE